MRPAAAPAFLARQTDLLSDADFGAGPHCRINDLQMAVAIIPAAIVEQINNIVTWLRRAIVVAGQNLIPRRNHLPRSRSDDFRHALRTARIESVMVINLFVAWLF